MVSLATRPRLCAVLEDVLGKDGGAGRNRTDDLYNAIVALSQLSYGPLPYLSMTYKEFESYQKAVGCIVRKNPRKILLLLA